MNIEKAQVARMKTREPPTELTIAVRAEELHQAARDILLGLSIPQHNEPERNHVSKDDKTMMILKAINDAGRPLRSGEIAEATGLIPTSITRHIDWNMLNVWVEVEAEKKHPRNSRTIKYYGLTPRGNAELGRMQ